MQKHMVDAAYGMAVRGFSDYQLLEVSRNDARDHVKDFLIWLEARDLLDILLAEDVPTRVIILHYVVASWEAKDDPEAGRSLQS